MSSSSTIHDQTTDSRLAAARMNRGTLRGRTVAQNQSSPADFASVLAGHIQGDRAARAREAAAQIVSAALVQPILASLHESTFAAGPFGPTMAEKRFGPMFDALLADRITKAANFPITNLIAQRLLA